MKEICPEAMSSGSSPFLCQHGGGQGERETYTGETEYGRIGALLWLIFLSLPLVVIEKE